MEPLDWHRLLALFLQDFFRGSPFDVLNEIDLSSKVQLLDVVVIRRREGEFVGPLPDGLGPLTDLNLLSFKSFRQTLDAWAMKELIGHYVNYRKQVSPSFEDLIPEERFRLIALTARYPAQLASQIPLLPVQDGVYDCLWGTDRVRVVVIRQLQLEDRNAILQLFSAVPAQIEFARDHYRRRSPDSSMLIQRLLAHYGKEGQPMPYTLEDFRRDVRKDVIDHLTEEEVMAVVDEKQIPVEKRLAGISPEQRLAGISPEQRLAGMSPESIEEYLRKLKGASS